MNQKDFVYGMIAFIGIVIGISSFVLWLISEVGIYITIGMLIFFSFIGISTYMLKKYIHCERNLKREQQRKLEREASFFHELTHHKERLFSQINRFILWKEQSNCDFIEAFEQLNMITEKDLENEKFQINS